MTRSPDAGLHRLAARLQVELGSVKLAAPMERLVEKLMPGLEEVLEAAGIDVEGISVEELLVLEADLLALEEAGRRGRS